jgi:hypothetical protein
MSGPAALGGFGRKLRILCCLQGSFDFETDEIADVETQNLDEGSCCLSVLLVGVGIDPFRFATRHFGNPAQHWLPRSMVATLESDHVATGCTDLGRQCLLGEARFDTCLPDSGTDGRPRPIAAARNHNW